MKAVTESTTAIGIVFMFLIVCTSTSAEAQERAIFSRAERVGMPEEILLTARAESRQGAKATLGKPIVLIVTTKNVTDERWSLYRTNFLLDYGIEVRDGDGHKVGLTEEGVRRYERAGAYYSREGSTYRPEEASRNDSIFPGFTT